MGGDRRLTGVGSLRRVALPAVLVVAGLAGCGAGAEDVRTAAPDPDTPVSTSVLPGPEPALDDVGGPTLVEPTPDAVDVHPRPFEEAAALGQQELAVRWWGGVAPCHVLDRVEVAATATEVRVTLFTGTAPGAGDVVCIELAVWYETRVALAEPLAGRPVVDGARAE